MGLQITNSRTKKANKNCQVDKKITYVQLEVQQEGPQGQQLEAELAVAVAVGVVEVVAAVVANLMEPLLVAQVVVVVAVVVEVAVTVESREKEEEEEEAVVLVWAVVPEPLLVLFGAERLLEVALELRGKII